MIFVLPDREEASYFQADLENLTGNAACTGQYSNRHLEAFNGNLNFKTATILKQPFQNFQGTVEDTNPERGRMKVIVPVFGRPTPVELEYYQVERL